jgi:3-oxocholest-4-en-26-oyl-CoA dehydrogenase beta subunit
MDFAFSEEQEALRELARKILGDHTAHDRLKEIEKGPDWFDHALWMELAKANLLGVALPATLGGSGLGFLELCVLLEEVGRAVAPVPVWPTLFLGALPVNQFGTPEQRERLLPKVVSGEGILTAAASRCASRPRISPRAFWFPPGRTTARSASSSSTPTHLVSTSPARQPPPESHSSASP